MGIIFNLKYWLFCFAILGICAYVIEGGYFLYYKVGHLKPVRNNYILPKLKWYKDFWIYMYFFYAKLDFKLFDKQKEQKFYVNFLVLISAAEKEWQIRCGANYFKGAHFTWPSLHYYTLKHYYLKQELLQSWFGLGWVVWV